jgi:hypothetical protein
MLNPGDVLMATEAKPQAQPDAAHEAPVDPAARPAAGGASLHEVRQEVRQLQERIDQIAQSAAPAPQAPVLSDPDLGANPPAHHPLQDLLPEIKDLAQRVGGMKELAQIVTTLAQTKE